MAAVESMGLTNWFEMQLHPEKIDDSVLETRLSTEFPAMFLSQQELMARYPSMQMIRMMGQRQQAMGSMEMGGGMGPLARRRGGTPAQQLEPAIASDPVERAIYADQVAFYQMQQQRKADNAAAANVTGASAGMASTVPVAPNASVSTAASPADTHVEKLFRDLDAVKILNLPPDARMRRIVAMSPAEFVSFRQSLGANELIQFAQGLSGHQREIFAGMQNSTRMVGAEEMQVRLLRDIDSNRQLEAVMTDFWLNHFNVYVRKNGDEPYLIPAYERDVIRPHALGKFEDLLVATAQSPAMQVYLDNWQSIGPNSRAAGNTGRLAAMVRRPQVKAALKDRGLNENYARELMELHTLGVNGGYTQNDVIEVARVFTGWGIDQPLRGGSFQFDERKHEPGAKMVLGKTIPEGGMNEGLEVLHMLATSPATAKFVSTKLAVRFVSDDPPQSLIERMSKAYLKSDGDIRTVLRTMFEAPEFWAPNAERAKVKTPEEFVISAVRASGAQVNNSLALVSALDKLGMPLYGMQTPNGYSWKSDPWVGTGALVSRMNFALALAGDHVPGVRTDWGHLLAGVTPSRADKIAADDAMLDPKVLAKERQLEALLLNEPLSEKSRDAVLDQSNDTTTALQAAREFQAGGGGNGKVDFGSEGEVARIFGVAAAGSQRNPSQDDRQAAIMAGLMLGSPEFQRR